jgi:hypothetical protein
MAETLKGDIFNFDPRKEIKSLADIKLPTQAEMDILMSKGKKELGDMLDNFSSKMGEFDPQTWNTPFFAQVEEANWPEPLVLGDANPTSEEIKEALKVGTPGVKLPSLEPDSVRRMENPFINKRLQSSEVSRETPSDFNLGK